MRGEKQRVRSVFLTPLTLSGFESLENKKRTEATLAVLLLFLVRVFITDSMNKLLTAVKHTLFKLSLITERNCKL